MLNCGPSADAITAALAPAGRMPTVLEDCRRRSGVSYSKGDAPESKARHLKAAQLGE